MLRIFISVNFIGLPILVKGFVFGLQLSLFTVGESFHVFVLLGFVGCIQLNILAFM
jgi:hypothetical protein